MVTLTVLGEWCVGGRGGSGTLRMSMQVTNCRDSYGVSILPYLSCSWAAAVIL